MDWRHAHGPINDMAYTQ